MTANHLLFVCGVVFIILGARGIMFGKTDQEAQGGCGLFVLGLAACLTAIFRPM